MSRCVYTELYYTQSIYLILYVAIGWLRSGDSKIRYMNGLITLVDQLDAAIPTVSYFTC